MAQLSAPTPDATTTSKGKVQLAGDLAGTAAAPTVAKISGVAVGGDPLTQYVLLNGRSTAQQINFGTATGESAGFMSSTSNATKGKFFLNAAGTITVDELNVRIGINNATPGSKLSIVGATPASVSTATGTASDNAVNTSAGVGGTTTIATTGTGGVGAGMTLTLGNGGLANSATTSSTGGAGGALALTTGTGGASSVAGGASANGGNGGAITITTGVGGAATTSTATNGGNGGAITIKAGAGGAGTTSTGTAGTIIFQTSSGSGAATTKLTMAGASMTVGDAYNINFGSTTGTQLATVSTQKIGFYGATPVVQQTSATAAPAGGTGTAAGGWSTSGNRDIAITLINAMRTALLNLGLIA